MAIEREVTILNTWGLHVRPSSALAAAAGKFSSRIEVVKDGRAVDAKSPIALLTLAAVMGTRLTIRAEGPDAQAAVDALAALAARQFDMSKEVDA
jgi:phosphotransferase system HPr (HPr) family protein